jgi:hypothetical protein
MAMLISNNANELNVVLFDFLNSARKLSSFVLPSADHSSDCQRDETDRYFLYKVSTG